MNEVELMALFDKDKIPDDPDFRWLLDNGFLPDDWNPADSEGEPPPHWTRCWRDCTVAPEYYAFGPAHHDDEDSTKVSCHIYIDVHKVVDGPVKENTKWKAAVYWSSAEPPVDADPDWEGKPYFGATPFDAIRALSVGINLRIFFKNIRTGGQIQ